MGKVRDPRLQAFDDAIVAVRRCQLAFVAPTDKYLSMYDATICQLAADLKSRRDAVIAHHRRKTSDPETGESDG